jgi:SAM-dependent methyltransferase
MDADIAPLIPGESMPRPGRSDVQQFDQKSFHRWYNFVLGFSDQLVEKILNTLSIGAGTTVLDPFCGTGTTMVECAKNGIPSIGIDANPFAVFAARVKSRFDLDPEALMRGAARVAARYQTIYSTNRRFYVPLKQLLVLSKKQ